MKITPGARAGLRELVAKRLGEIGQATPRELALTLPAKPSTISARLDELQELGRAQPVRKAMAPSGRGRPTWVWELTTVLDTTPTQSELFT